MARKLKQSRGLLLLVLLLAITARVFTGASEAQVNFTSLIVDQNLAYQHVAHAGDHHHHEVLKSAENASSIPEKHRTYATYKKYVTPDKSFAVEIARSHDQTSVDLRTAYVSGVHIHSSVFLPLANAPPAVVSVRSSIYTTRTDASVALENNFGAIEIDNGAGGLGRFQL